jgi:uncharacterized protein
VRSTEDLLRPPTEEEVARALRRFAADVERLYGPALVDVYLYGSRARGDHHPHSDVDVAVVLRDGTWSEGEEGDRLADLTYDILIEDGADIQALPVSETDWSNPARHPNPSLLRTMRRDAKRLRVP